MYFSYEFLEMQENHVNTMQIALSIFTFRLTGSIPSRFFAPRGHFAVLRGALWRLFGGSEIASKAIFYCFCSEISIIFLSL